MTNKTGKICGFVLGVTAFLVLFKMFVLVRIQPSDELAPGIVVLASIVNGMLFAFVGSGVQRYFVKKKKHN